MPHILRASPGRAAKFFTLLLFQLGIVLGHSTTLVALEWGDMPDPGRSSQDILKAWQAAESEIPAELRVPKSNDANGSKPVSVSRVEPQLRWLKRHQSPDGGWSATGHPMACSLDGPKVEPDIATGAWGIVGGERDTLLCAGSVLAFLGAGWDHRIPNKYRRTVLAGLNKLIESIAEGAPPLTHHQTQAMVALALSEAYVMTQDADIHDPAQRAMEALLSSALTSVQGAETVTVGWAATPDGQEVDLQATLLGVMALKSAAAGAMTTTVSPHLNDIRLWFSALLTDSQTYHVAANRTDRFLPRRASIDRKQFHGEGSASGLALAVYLGLKMEHEALFEGVGERVMDQLIPMSTSDPFTTYAATVGLTQVREPWRTQFRLVQTWDLVQHNIHSDDCRDGSWPAHPGSDANIGSSVLTTTILNSFSLQIFYTFHSPGEGTSVLTPPFK